MYKLPLPLPLPSIDLRHPSPSPTRHLGLRMVLQPTSWPLSSSSSSSLVPRIQPESRRLHSSHRPNANSGQAFEHSSTQALKQALSHSLHAPVSARLCLSHPLGPQKAEGSQLGIRPLKLTEPGRGVVCCCVCCYWRGVNFIVPSYLKRIANISQRNATQHTKDKAPIRPHLIHSFLLSFIHPIRRANQPSPPPWPARS